MNSFPQNNLNHYIGKHYTFNRQQLWADVFQIPHLHKAVNVSGKLKTDCMQNSINSKKNFKTVALVNFATAIFMSMCSIIGHYFTPYSLIPSSVFGGIIGLLCGVYLCLKLKFI